MHRAIFLGLFLSAAACGGSVIYDGEEGGAPQNGGFAGAGGIGPEGGLGGGPAPECAVADDCGVSTECLVFSCDLGICSVLDNEGQYVPDPVGNCAMTFCMGGVPVPQPADDAPPPADCAVFGCDGLDVVPYLDGFGTECPGGECDSEGACVACLADPDCTTWPCPRWSLAQIPYNCQLEMCADSDTPTWSPDDSDIPSATDCTTLYSCENGALTAEPAVEGSPCHGGEGECTSSGECACVSNCECSVLTDCPAPTTYCVAAQCSLGFCDTAAVLSGGSPYQIEGNCEYIFCTPFGFMPINGSDAPADTECGIGGCGLNGPTLYPLAIGTPCSTGYCNGALGFPQCVACYEGMGTCSPGFHCPAIGASSCVPDP